MRELTESSNVKENLMGLKTLKSIESRTVVCSLK